MYELKRIDLLEHEIICKESICQNNAVFVLEKQSYNNTKILGYYCNFHSIINKDYYEWKNSIVWMNIFVWIPVFWLFIYIPTIKVGKSNIVLKYQKQYNRTIDGRNLEVINKKSKDITNILNLDRGKKLFVWFLVLFIMNSIGLVISFGFETNIIIQQPFQSFENHLDLYLINYIFLFAFTYIFNFLNIILTSFFLKYKTKPLFISFLILTTLSICYPSFQYFGAPFFGAMYFILIILGSLYFKKINIITISDNQNLLKKPIKYSLIAFIFYCLAFLALIEVHNIFITSEPFILAILFSVYIPSSIVFCLIIVLQILMYFSKNKKRYLYILFILIPISGIITPGLYYGSMFFVIFWIMLLISNIFIYLKIR